MKTRALGWRIRARGRRVTSCGNYCFVRDRDARSLRKTGEELPAVAWHHLCGVGFREASLHEGCISTIIDNIGQDV